LINSELQRPVFVTAPAGDQERLFIVEQHTGRIRILRLANDSLDPTPFLEITDLPTGNEQGLLGLAFHPKFATNGTFFVNLTAPGGAFNRGVTEVRRYRVSADPDVADPSSATKVITFDQPFTNHNGGWIEFGPRDGFLYVAAGDGGNANDPGNRAQNLRELLGKLLRIDVDGDDFPGDANRHYRIPPGNPFVNRPDARPEIWAFGLRNPWRCSFDRQTANLYIADAGQAKFEEINFQPASSTGGENYGWRLKEGNLVTQLDPLDAQRLVDPIHEYSHDDGLAIIGGYVYRGNGIPGLAGTYFFADHTGRAWSLRFDGTLVSEFTERTAELFPADGPQGISSFGEDAAGELYITDVFDGTVHRVTA
jgi:glucose/arabinose dehydrogenase